MTTFAGAFALQSHPLPQTVKTSLQQHLRSVKNDEGNWDVYDQQSIFLVKWDSGAFNEPA